MMRHGLPGDGRKFVKHAEGPKTNTIRFLEYSHPPRRLNTKLKGVDSQPHLIASRYFNRRFVSRFFWTTIANLN